MAEKSNYLNPYDILGVSPGASKAEITKAVAMAMKRKEYPLKDIAEAQKSLMDSKQRLIADYLRPILTPIKRFKRQDFSALDMPAPELSLLAEMTVTDGNMAEKVATLIRENLNPELRLNATANTIEPQAATPSPQNLSVKFILSAVPDSPQAQRLTFDKTKWEVNGINLFFDGLRFCFWLFILLMLLNTVMPKLLSEPQPQKQTVEELEIQAGAVMPRGKNDRSSSPTRRERDRPKQVQTSRPFSEIYYAYRFPKNTCGNRDPGGTNDWYPVYVKYSEYNLTKIRNFYCGDALKNRRQTGEMSIQVASFLNQQDALDFANVMQSELGSAEVGRSSRDNFAAPAIRANAAQIVRNQSGSFPLSSCGDSHPGELNTWYPVHVDYSENNLQLITNHYCQDAFATYSSSSNQQIIQVAYFLDISDARTFANFLRQQIGSGNVGEAATY